MKRMELADYIEAFLRHQGLPAGCHIRFDPQKSSGRTRAKKGNKKIECPPIRELKFVEPTEPVRVLFQRMREHAPCTDFYGYKPILVGPDKKDIKPGVRLEKVRAMDPELTEAQELQLLTMYRSASDAIIKAESKMKIPQRDVLRHVLSALIDHYGKNVVKKALG